MEQLAAFISFTLGAPLSYELALLVGLVLILNIKSSLKTALQRFSE